VGALTKSYKKSNEQTAREMACSLDLMENWLKADAFILMYPEAITLVE
jgi:hypothetical protein